jgi:hypothetical protein
MFNNFKKKREENKQKRVQENEIKKQKEKSEKKERARREAEIWENVEKRVEKYLSNKLPSFLLLPDAKPALITILRGRSSGKRFEINLQYTDGDLLFNFYDTELNNLIEELEKHGFLLSGNEKRFTEQFINAINKRNYEAYSEKYGEFLDNSMDMKEAVYSYYSVLGSGNDMHDVGHLAFLSESLYKTGVLDKRMGIIPLNNEVKKYPEEFGR